MECAFVTSGDVVDGRDLVLFVSRLGRIVGVSRHKEIWTHFLANNLIRSAMCAAAIEHDILSRQISFCGTQQVLTAFYGLLTTSLPEKLESICTIVINAIAEHRVGDRPNRYEHSRLEKFEGLGRPRRSAYSISTYPSKPRHAPVRHSLTYSWRSTAPRFGLRALENSRTF